GTAQNAPANRLLRAPQAGYWIENEDGAVAAKGTSFYGSTYTDTTTGGRASFVFTSVAPGRSDITASVSTAQSKVTSNVVSTTWQAGPPAVVSITPQNPTLTVGTPLAVTATTTDEFGNPVADGTSVTFNAQGTGGELPAVATG